MRIITYNVNGLRARIIPYRTLGGFLKALDADIICLQETKLSRDEITADIATAEGYEAFFSCTRTVGKGRLKYSGILPIAADEGFTGMLHRSKTGDIKGNDRVGFYDDVLNSGFTNEELLQLDKEGRCVITDHGSFVLFNVYGPCVQPDDIARLEFKLKFYQVMQYRWESLLRAGKRLIVVGDLNISPYPIDSCDPGPYFDSNPCRKWLRSLLSCNDGPFTDAYRAVHGLKEGAYTCWCQASGAEEFNYGTRIDLILVAGPCVGLCKCEESSVDCKGFAQCAVEDSDIMVEFKRSKEDSAPRWAGGRNMKLEGSDHVPVFLSLKDQPPVKPHNVPSFAVRFLPQLHGRQQSIYTLLQRSDRSFSKVNTHLASDTILHVDSGQGSLDIRDTVVTSNSCELVSSPTESEGNGMGEAKLKVNGDDLQFEASVERQTPILKAQSVQRFKRNLVQKGKQTNLKAFFAHSLCQNAHSLLNISKSEESNEIINKTTSLGDDEAQENDSQENFDAVATTCTGTHFPEETSFNTKIFKIENLEGETVHAKWKRIGDLMARRIPVCRHGEPCVARKVKKSGPNYGRGFYVCARAAGPPSNPEARCDHFEWASGKWKK